MHARMRLAALALAWRSPRSGRWPPAADDDLRLDPRGDGDATGLDLTWERRVRLVRTTCGRGARRRVTRVDGVETTTVAGSLCP